MPVAKTPPEERFWKKVLIKGKDDCWLWIGERTNKGYGRFTPEPKRRDENGFRPTPKLAHRLAWQYSKNPIPSGLECCHHCDNRACCNPNHLYIGSHADNMEDMRQRNHDAVKLTDQKVREIREKVSSGSPIRRIGREYGVSQRMIQFVVRRKWWKHVV